MAKKCISHEIFAGQFVEDGICITKVLGDIKLLSQSLDRLSKDVAETL